MKPSGAFRRSRTLGLLSFKRLLRNDKYASAQFRRACSGAARLSFVFPSCLWCKKCVFVRVCRGKEGSQIAFTNSNSEKLHAKIAAYTFLLCLRTLCQNEDNGKSNYMRQFCPPVAFLSHKISQICVEHPESEQVQAIEFSKYLLNASHV